MGPGLRVPLETYLRGGGKVYSLVVSIPFSPLDIDLGRLSRGEWNPLADRFRVWYLPPGDGGGDGPPVCYVMIRKFDLEDRVLLYGHVVIKTDRPGGEEPLGSFTVGIMCNDEVRARSMLNSMVDIPPAFHRRSEVTLIERKWRSDPAAVMRFLANIHSVLANLTPNPSGKVYAVKFEPPKEILGELKRGMGSWW